MRRTKSGGYPVIPRAKGRALSLLASELQTPRRGLLEHVPWLGDWLLRNRLLATRLRSLQAERAAGALLFGPTRGSDTRLIAPRNPLAL